MERSWLSDGDENRDRARDLGRGGQRLCRAVAAQTRPKPFGVCLEQRRRSPIDDRSSVGKEKTGELALLHAVYSYEWVSGNAVENESLASRKDADHRGAAARTTGCDENACAQAYWTILEEREKFRGGSK